MDEKLKWAISLILLAASAYLLYDNFVSSKTSLEPGRPIGRNELEKTIIEKPLCIVARVPSKEPGKSNVVNCALEYFQTSLLSFPKKKVEWYVMDGSYCEAIVKSSCETFPCDGEQFKGLVSECEKKILSSSCYVIDVSEGNSSLTNSYENMLKVFVDDYAEGSCSIRASSS